MIHSSSLIREKVIVAAVAMLVILGLVGCTTAVFLQSNVADPSKILASSIADKKFNVVRFETFGPYPEQIFGYVLYGDDADVRTISIPLEKLGKMNLKEVLADYDKTRRTRNWYRASSPVIREVLRGGNVIALTASDDMMDVQIWDDTALGAKENKTILFLNYDDRRRMDKDSGNTREPDGR